MALTGNRTTEDGKRDKTMEGKGKAKNRSAKKKPIKKSEMKKKRCTAKGST